MGYLSLIQPHVRWGKIPVDETQFVHVSQCPRQLPAQPHDIFGGQLLPAFRALGEVLAQCSTRKVVKEKELDTLDNPPVVKVTMLSWVPARAKASASRRVPSGSS
jgi:hypothetical protein